MRPQTGLRISSYVMRWFSELDGGNIPEFLGDRGSAVTASTEPAAPASDARVIVVAISSVDGRGAISGKSSGLGNDADLHLLKSLRDSADVIVVGSSTVRAEGYCGVGRDEATKRFGGPAHDRPVPPIAVLTRGFELDPESRFFADAEVPPIVIGPKEFVGRPAAVPDDRASRLASLERTGATVLMLDDTDPAFVVDALRNRGYARIVVEGGPRVYRSFFEADIVDEVFLTLAPVVVGDGPATFGGDSAGGTADIGGSRDGAATPVTSATPTGFVAEAAAFSDSHVFVRYSRLRTG